MTLTSSPVGMSKSVLKSTAGMVVSMNELRSYFCRQTQPVMTYVAGFMYLIVSAANVTDFHLILSN